MIGSKLGNYAITTHLGSGGMGEVYEANDVKLGRSVAIKVLLPAFASDPARVARFGREARVLASLNHPNIAAIYGLEESAGQSFLVMELVGGETLAERIARGPIPLDEAFVIAKQILEALEAAHEKGIVHRDLKPANIKVTPDGKVKVLDFGLAKALETEPANNTALSNSPTLTMAATNAGMILGTAAYMSPEQARGRSVDRRTDIFAFGSVLFEMLTGRAAFGGEDVADILGAVLKSEPNWSLLRADVPPSWRRVLRLCLEKNPRSRRADAADIRIDLEQAIKDLETEELVPSSAYAMHLTWLIAGVMGIAFSWIAVVHFSETHQDAREMRLEISTPPSSAPLDFAISPDGTSLVFVASAEGVQRLWLRRLDKTVSQPLAGTDDASFPFWSPDSKSIGFFASGKLKRIDASGGGAQELTNAGIGRGGTWNSEGVILFAPLAGSAIFRIPAKGGTPSPVTTIGPTHPQHRFPEFLPDGRHFIFLIQGNAESQGIYLASLDGGAEPKKLTAAETGAVYLKPDRIAFVRQGRLMAQRLDLSRAELIGDPETIADSVGTNQLFRGGFAVSPSGLIAYRRGESSRTQLVWYDRAGKSLGVAGAPDENSVLAPELSPDGKRLGLDRTVESNRDVWLLDLLKGGFTRFTFDSSVDGYPVWSPDGKQIAFESNRTGPYAIYVKSASMVGKEAPAATAQSEYGQWPLDWSKDGRFILYHEDNTHTNADVAALPMTGNDRKPVVVANSSFSERTGQFSPDGRWVAYDTNESGPFQIVVQPFPNPTAKFQISTGGGVYPRWRPDGKELYFLAPDGKLMAATVRTTGTSFEWDAPVALFQTHMSTNFNKQNYTVSSDGRFLINQTLEDSAVTPIVLILNWKPSR